MVQFLPVIPHRALASAVLVLSLAAPAWAAAPRALFDNAHAETSGNSDWVIDTDQPVPLPAQSTVGPATARTYWLGGISSWGIDLVKRGYQVATNIAPITYGNASNLYDLSKWDVFILPEPNTRFTAAESTAIFNYVRDGGGVIFVVDHYGSDRNNDGWDSPRIYNAFDTQQLWGIHWQVSGESSNSISQDSGNVESSPTDSIIHGPNGVADSLSFHAGDTAVLSPATNPRVRGLVWMNGLAHGTTGLMAARSEYGSGRIVTAGDSSPIDDGSAAPGNSSIFDGWGEASGRDSLFFLNATFWATRRPADTAAPIVALTDPNGGELWYTGSSHPVSWTASDNFAVTSVRLDYSLHGAAGPWNPIASSIPNSPPYGWTVPDSVSDSVLVRVTAFDAALNQASDASDAMFRIHVFPTGVEDALAAAVALARPTPNPSAERVALSFNLPAPAPATLEILDVSGRRVRAIATGEFAAGEHTAPWDGRDERGNTAGAGLYFARLVTPWNKRTVRLVRIP